MIELNKIHQGNCLEVLRTFPDESINCCVTSPPYFGLRDYGHSNQIGLEETPELFVEKMVEVFNEVKRVLKKEGTLWLNLGDSYAGSGGAHKENHKNPGISNSFKRNGVPHFGDLGQPGNYMAPKGMKAKDLIGIPWMVAFALRSSGWYLRQDIIWSKPNPMPESVTDRCTKSHEYIFLLSKSAKYYYDAEAIKTPLTDSSVARLVQDVENQEGSNRVPGKSNGNMKAVKFGGTKGDGNDRSGIYSGKEWYPKLYKHRGEGDKKLTGHSGNYDSNGDLIGNGFANKRSVWTVTTKPFSEAHFATFPEDLIVDCIKAGCPENGIVLDPFSGAGTTALVARKLNRSYIGIELNPAYIEISNKRLYNELGMFI